MIRCITLMALALLSAQHAAAQPIAIPADKALIVIRVPTEDAVVKISDFTSTQRGLERMYFSPELAPGVYAYPVEVQWTENGTKVKASRKVQLEPGRMTTVVFTQADGVAVAKPKTGEKKPAVVAGKERHFLFTYAGAIKDLKPGTEASVWLPVAVNGPEQKVKIRSMNLAGITDAKVQKEKEYGNSMVHFTAKANEKGMIPFEIVYDVSRREVKTDVQANLTLKPVADDNLSRFLKPDNKVPITGKPLELIKDKKLPADQFATAKVLYDVVNTHMKYSKDGVGWGQGDSVWACDSKFGNCSDFHSLFISMARGNKIPSKFEMGFPIPAKRGDGAVGGYHCWAWFLPNEKGWVPVDISEANRFPEMKDYYFGNLTEDRVRFSTGRDINLAPRQKAGALNFFIYPYAEVDGKVHPQEKVDRRFAYQDVK